MERTAGMTCMECTYRNRCGLARLQGIGDRLDGELVKDNPYSPHTLGEAQSWELGWQTQDAELRLIEERDDALEKLARIHNLVVELMEV